jgi:hypothetical protein
MCTTDAGVNRWFDTFRPTGEGVDQIWSWDETMLSSDHCG